jgi:glucosyl-dolichyl phosphate glucuronosyltransferase
MDLSVILCTHNRCDSLATSIHSIVEQQGLQGVRWELVVVDNASNDDTTVVVAELAVGSPVPIRCVREPRLGLSRARNRGIASTCAPVLAFTDDDIVAETSWLDALWSTMQQNQCDVVGGRIRLLTQHPVPVWVDARLLGCLGALDLGEHPVTMDGNTLYPFGANMMFDRRAFRRAGAGFDERLGRRGGGRRWWELLKGEEQELVERIVRAGGRALYCPDAVVWHRVAAEQVNKKRFRSLFFASGYQFVMTHGVPLKPTRSSFSLEVLGKTLRYVARRVREGADSSFGGQLDVCFLVGMLAALFGF